MDFGVHNSPVELEESSQSNSIPHRGSCEQFSSCLQNPPASNWVASPLRRIVDFSVAFLALVLLFVPMLVIATLIKITSKGPALFKQEREGLSGQMFRIYKFRTMEVEDKERPGPSRTQEGDPRITPIGRYLRKLKLDELPQMYNVLRGKMSIVGPRPKLPQHTEIRNMPYRPGATGRATLAFLEEEKLLGIVESDGIETFYETHIRPRKDELDRCYMCHASFLSDLRIMIATAFSPIAPHLFPQFAEPGVAIAQIAKQGGRMNDQQSFVRRNNEEIQTRKERRNHF